LAQCTFNLNGTICNTNDECTEINNGYRVLSNTLINYIHGIGCFVNFNNKPGYYKLISGYAQCFDTYTCSLVTPETTGCSKSNAGRLVTVNNEINLCTKVNNINGISLKNDYFVIIPFSNSTDKYLVKKEDTFLKFDNTKSEYYIMRNSENSITIDTNYNYNVQRNIQFKKDNKPLEIAICAVAKNENLYIREWVEWYKNLGISKIFLYDNNELEGERFEEVISDYIENGFVEVIDRRGIVKSLISDKNGTTVQGKAYQDCYYSNYKEFDWLFFFDIDEFISLDYKYNNIFEFLNDFKDFDGIKVQWRMFGDNGKLFFENKPVIERFGSKDNVGYDNHIKSILKCKSYSFNLIFCAHGSLNIELVTVNLNKKRVKSPYMDSMAYKDLPVYLNHFYSKSTEEFIKRKYKRTSAISGEDNTRNFSLNFIKNQYFEYNKYTKEKESMFNTMEEEK